MRSIEIYSEKELPKLINILDEAKLYSRHLNKDYKGTLEKYEPKRDTEEINASVHPLSFADYIDTELKPEVENDLKLIEERIIQNQKEQAALEKRFRNAQ